MRGITRPWGDGEYSFRLKIKEIKELQATTGEGVGNIARRVMSGWPNYLDLYETIRLALIGGGTPPVKAKQLVDMYVDDMPLATPGDPGSPMATAQAIFEDLWFGPQSLEDLFKDEVRDLGKAEGGRALQFRARLFCRLGD